MKRKFKWIKSKHGEFWHKIPSNKCSNTYIMSVCGVPIKRSAAELQNESREERCVFCHFNASQHPKYKKEKKGKK